MQMGKMYFGRDMGEMGVTIEGEDYIDEIEGFWGLFLVLRIILNCWGVGMGA